MRTNTNLHWKQGKYHHILVVITCTIVHSCVVVSVVKHISEIPRRVLNIKNRQKKN